MAKIKAKSEDFQSLTKNKELWNEIINSSNRNAVLVASSAMDILLERILAKHLMDVDCAKRIATNFSSRIDACYSLGLIEEKEHHDLHIVREIRNAFAHNLFNCHFSDKQIKSRLDNFMLAKEHGLNSKSNGVDMVFNFEILTLDSLLYYRLSFTKRVSVKQKIRTGGARKN